MIQHGIHVQFTKQNKFMYDINKEFTLLCLFHDNVVSVELVWIHKLLTKECVYTGPYRKQNMGSQ
jgi:hypothetical protein